MSMLTLPYKQTKNFAGTHYVDLIAGKKTKIDKPEPLKGFKRVVKLLILCFMLPLIFLIYPLYLRNRVYIQQTYPIGVSDMRIIDNKISTTWCQKQVINSNTTFNAYVIANEPRISRKIEKIDMRRSMVLQDGAKEYWGFYLLKGSSFTVSSCVRWPGASLIAIEGHMNLKECAYVGDNSSEERDNSVSSEEDRNKTFIEQMTKILPGITVNYKVTLGKNIHLSESNKSNEFTKISSIDGKTKNIHLKYAEDLYAKDRKKKLNKQKELEPSENGTKYSDSAEVLTDVLNKLKSLGPKGRSILQKLNNQTNDGFDNTEGLLNQIDQMIKEISEKNLAAKGKKRKNDNDVENVENDFNSLREEIMNHRRMKLMNDDDADDETKNNAQEESDGPTDKFDFHGSKKYAKNGDRSKSEYWSSFSSSEERLLGCRGLLISLPLIPQNTCDQKYDKKHLDEIAAMNGITYSIQSDGYYFFIFNNENEVEKNYMYARFQINKTVYDTSEAVVACQNETKECSLPLSFWSRERTILELPLPTNDALWNEEFMFTTHCEPRSILYIICLMSVPAGILLFAFT